MQPALFSPNVRICRNEGIWHNGHYYLKTASDDCKAYVSLFLQNSPKQNWLFVGDSATRRTVNEYRRQHESCFVAERCNGDENCDLKRYINVSSVVKISKTKNSSMPTSRENDKRIGCLLMNVGLTGCANRLDICGKWGEKEIEYIAVRYPFNELEVTAIWTKLTLLFSYLGSSHQRDVCVLNVGLHPVNITVQKYTSKVESFIARFAPFCHRIIWLTANSVRGDKKYSQRNNDIIDKNAMILKMIIDTYPDIGIIDMFPMSTLADMHVDNAHLNETYYDKASSFFLQQ